MVGVLIDRSPFLQRGLLPLAALVSTVPLVGIAPIMVMWFGFDWQSKAAVVVVMTFFPMLVNTLAGLAAAGHMERDLMRSYGAGYWRTLVKLRMPVALPFIFNALKINSTLALIGAIVAEFFGSPVVGLGFRICTEVGAPEHGPGVGGDRRRGAGRIDALRRRSPLDRAAHCTFWHPSFRQEHELDGATTRRRATHEEITDSGWRRRPGVVPAWARPAQDKVTVQLKWLPQAQFAGYYVAEDKGFYKDAELDVTIKAGRPRHRPGAGDRRRRRRRDRRLDAVARWPRARRACRWSTSRRSSTAPA